MKLVVAITGASGVHLGKKFIDHLPSNIEVHVVVSNNALTVESFENRQVTLHSSENIAASISSGSFRVDATAIIPCSMNTLAKVACGISDNLPTRVAAVALKEQKKTAFGTKRTAFFCHSFRKYAEACLFGCHSSTSRYGLLLRIFKPRRYGKVHYRKMV